MREPPERDRLPKYLAPVPRAVEDLGLRLVWVVVGINLVGTAFGFWFYAFETGQLLDTPVVMWPWVPDSPAATLLAAAAFGSWARGNSREWLNAMAFFGNVILGLWTPFVLLVFADVYLQYQHPAMYMFLFWSHLAMVVQALVIYRISEFPPSAVTIAVAWYGLDLLVDFFVPVVGEPHHTVIPVERSAPMWLGADALGVVAAGAVTFTLLATYLSLAIRSKKLERRLAGRG
jgi:uncharacterized membrane protein YpjA